ncbi:uncharacterized protein LOC8085943 [Sorghum bicolor]|uniref:Uncharacterized protein n=1 Tax=Sorghum bicolor TaxID=4558 RepID=C5X160_SORBI|nr:uncharacterized protein LOC8085943 [Sorghum bicolor]EER90880.1 hypothetical protein SORBI_3001G091400 [Sorghum bicolor]|eukprot:XP_002463882.1 uncharacterized protein LOC8085943 [Sorghum bicolor]
MSPNKPSHASGRDAVFWSQGMNAYLIDRLLYHQDNGNRGESKFSSVAYDSIINGVGDKFGVTIDRNNIKNRLKYIKESFHECRNLLGEDSRFKWCSETRKFKADPNVWRELIQRKPEAKKWMMKTIDHYDRLMLLFGKDREKRPDVENSKGTAKKKARTEPPKGRLHRTPLNGNESAVDESLDKKVDKIEIPDASITNLELDLSELCRTDNGIVAIPVRANSYGKGLPYAPENWPHSGDIWHWKVGSRSSGAGHWADRYLMPPSRFRDATPKKLRFASRVQVEEFVKREFPDVDPSTFFSMFIWRIPAEGYRIQKGTQQVWHNEPEPVVADPGGLCKARNSLCNLEREGFVESSPARACNICCKEPGFCRECCCLLCNKTIDYSFGGYSFIKCEAVVEENLICGHSAHLNCALRSYMAGTVGGVFALDVQYLCRLCDNKINLMTHVEKLMETCQSLESRDEIEPMLNLGLCLLRGSKQMRARSLENQMRSAMEKLECGFDLAEVWKFEGDEGRATLSAGENSPPTSGVTVLGAHQVPETGALTGHPDLIDPLGDNDFETDIENLPVFITGDQNVASAKFEDEIDLALEELKKSQEMEYNLAEQKLYAQKDRILCLYRELDTERAQLADPMPLSDASNYGAMLANVLRLVDQIKRDEEKFKSMLKVAGGFAKAPPNVIKELFGLPADK